MENIKQVELPLKKPNSDLLNNRHIPFYTLENQNKGELTILASYNDKEDKFDDNEETKTTRLCDMPKKSIFMLGLICLGNFFGGAMFALLAPFYPAMATQKGVDQTTVGVVFAVFELVYFFVGPILGAYLVQIGPKFMYQSGLILLGVSTFVFGFLDKSPPGVTFAALSIACRAVGSLGMACIYTSQFAIASKLFPKNVATMFGVINSFQSVGLMAGPAVGGTLYQIGGFGLPFYVVGSAIVLMVFATIKLIPSVHEVTPENKMSTWTLFKSVHFCLGFLGVFVFALGISFMDPTIANHLSKLNMSPLEIGFVMAIAPAADALASPLWGYLCDNKNLHNSISLFVNCVVVFALCVIGPSPLFPFIPFTVTTVVLGLLIYGICSSGISLSSIKLLLVGAIDRGFDESVSTYGLVTGIMGSGYCTGAMVGPILGSHLVEQFGFPVTATLFAGPHLLYVIVSAPYFFYQSRIVKRNLSL